VFDVRRVVVLREVARCGSLSAAGNRGLLGLPLTIAGAVGRGFTNTGIVSAGAAAVPILLSANAVGLLLTTIWAAALGQNVNTTVYGVFSRWR
jgi:uncharacterized protein